MIRKGSSYSFFASWSVAAGAALALFSIAPSASADDVPATGKGIVGGALLGGEVVMLGEAAFGIKSPLAYILGGVVGAGGGGVAGYFIEKDADPKVSVYMLAGGLALIIPTTVAVLQASAYKPPDEYTEDRAAPGPVSEPPHPSSPGAPSTTAPPPAGPTTRLHYHWQPAHLTLPAGLLDYGEGAVHLAMPAIELRSVYTKVEQSKYGVEQQQELRVPVFSATF